MGHLQLTVTWYKIRHAGKQATHWDHTKQRKFKFDGMKSLCFGCPSAQLALQHSSVCGDQFNVDHTMVCRRGEFIIQRHNELRDLEVEMLSMVCNDVEIEPVLQ